MTYVFLAAVIVLLAACGVFAFLWQRERGNMRAEQVKVSAQASGRLMAELAAEAAERNLVAKQASWQAQRSILDAQLDSAQKIMTNRAEEIARLRKELIDAQSRDPALAGAALLSVLEDGAGFAPDADSARDRPGQDVPATRRPGDVRGDGNAR